MSTIISMKKGEAKTLTITVTDDRSIAVDLSASSLHLGFKTSKTSVSYVIEKNDVDFTKTNAELGIVSCVLTAANTNQTAGTYVGELTCTWTGPPQVIEKSADLSLIIEQSVS